MEITRAGSKPSGKGPPDWFTGTVRIDPLFNSFDPARVQVPRSPLSRVPVPRGTPILSGRRCTWGVGRVQRWGGPIEEIRPGDVVWFPPGEKHWHGAAPETAITHIALQEVQDGKVVDWMEHVSDEQYGVR